MRPIGGARPGAGRPAKAELFAGPVAAAEARIADHLPALIDKMFELALGVTVVELDKDGDVKRDPGGAPTIYTLPPNIKALIYLIDRIMGRGAPANADPTAALSDDELIRRAQGALASPGPPEPDA